MYKYYNELKYYTIWATILNVIVLSIILLSNIK